MNVSLSICIPTYNRSLYLEKTLDKILPIVKRYNCVDVFVSDNASNDNTEDICKKYLKDYSFFSYQRQEINIGADRNFEFLLKNANGNYIMLLGDGCYFEEKDFDLLIKEILSNKADLIILGERNRNKLDEDTIINDKDKLLVDLGWHITWLSSLVYSRKLITAAPFKRYYNSLFIQTGIVYEYFDSNPVNVVFKPSICLHSWVGKESGWISNVIDVFCKKWTLFVYSLPVSYSYEDKLKCIKTHAVKTDLFAFRKLVHYRINNYINVGNFLSNYYYIKQSLSISKIFSIIVLILIPRKLILLLLKIKHLIKY